MSKYLEEGGRVDDFGTARSKNETFLKIFSNVNVSLTDVNSFIPNVTFPYPLKISESLTVFCLVYKRV